jgi:hypothetical protein
LGGESLTPTGIRSPEHPGVAIPNKLSQSTYNPSHSYAKIIILSVILDGHETWSLIWSEERRLRVFENRVLRRIFEPKRYEVTGEWKKLHNEKLNVLYYLPTILRVIKSIRISWAGHVARMGRGEACAGCWWGNLRERHHWGDSGVDGRIILRWILRKWDVGYGQDLTG